MDMEHRIETDVQDMLSVLSDIYDRELVSVIGWAKQIPGSLSLTWKIQTGFSFLISILYFFYQYFG